MRTPLRQVRARMVALSLTALVATACSTSTATDDTRSSAAEVGSVYDAGTLHRIEVELDDDDFGAMMATYEANR